MAFSYTNRKGVTYYVHATRTKTNRVRYAAKRTPAGALEAVPDGYEVVENVNGQVSVRKARPGEILLFEERLVSAALERLELSDYRLEVRPREIWVFEPTTDCDAVVDALIGPWASGTGDKLAEMLAQEMRRQLGDDLYGQFLEHQAAEIRERVEAGQRYEPVMRFILGDAESRTFEAHRMSYMGEGGWYPLAAGPLARLAEEYLPHLGKESFYDLL